MADASSFSGITEAKQNLAKYGDSVVDRLHAITRHYGAVMQADIASRARGLFNTSAYDKSITVRMKGKKDSPAAVVASNDPQAHRLEFGFVGVDSLGRSIHQPPRPHFRPALAKYGAQYRQAVEALFQ